MFFRLNNIVLVRAPPYEEGYTYVERLANGKLCLVRKRRHSNKPKPKEYVEVCEENPQHGHSGAIHHTHRHDCTHRHIIRHGRRSSEENCANVKVYTQGPVHIHADKGTPIKDCRPQDSEPSPTWEIREPKVSKDPWIECERMHVRVVRVGKLQEEKVCICCPSQPKVPCEIHESDRVCCSTQGDYPRGVEEDKAVWDPVLRAWVVKRAPRVRFSASEAGYP